MILGEEGEDPVRAADRKSHLIPAPQGLDLVGAYRSIHCRMMTLEIEAVQLYRVEPMMDPKWLMTIIAASCPQPWGLEFDGEPQSRSKGTLKIPPLHINTRLYQSQVVVKRVNPIWIGRR
mgnify:CR=1 FL=1